MSKLVYSLVLWSEPADEPRMSLALGSAEPANRFEVMFRIYSMDDRFRASSFNTANGWRIRSLTSPELAFGDKTIFLYGTRPRNSEMKTVWTSIFADTLEEARAAVADLHAALADWAENFPGFHQSADGEPATTEVQESLLHAEDLGEQPEEEDVDAPPPVDEFVPHKISI